MIWIHVAVYLTFSYVLFLQLFSRPVIRSKNCSGGKYRNLISRFWTLADLENIVAARQNLGLGNVDNTSDLNKPVSTAVQNSLNGLQLGSLSNVSVSGAPSNHVMYGNGSSWVPVQIQPDYMLAPSAGESIAVNEFWFTFTAARSGSVRLRFQHYGGNNDQGNNLKVYRDGSELVSWYTFSPTPIDRVIDVSFSAGQRIYYTETGGGGLISASIRMANRTLFRL